MEIMGVGQIAEYVAEVSKAGLPLSAFSSAGFLETWWEYYGADLEFLGLLGCEGDQIVAALPLYRLPSRLSRTWRVVGDTLYNVAWIPALESYLEPFLYSAFAYLATASVSGGVIISDVPSNGELFQILQSRGTIHHLYECPFVCIAGNWPDVYPTLLSKKRRAEVRRGMARLCKAGTLSHVVIDGNNAALLPQVLPDCVRLHQERFQGTTNTSGFSDPRYTGLYETLLSRMCAEDNAWLSVALLDGIPISFVLGFIQGNTFVDAIPAFDPAFGKFGLGHVHLFLLLEELNTRSIEVFDFSKGNSVYKQKWATGSIDQYTIMISTGVRPPVDMLAARLWTELKAFGRRHNINSRAKKALARAKLICSGNDASLPAVLVRGADVDSDRLEWHRIASYQQIRDWPLDLRLAIMDDFYLTTTWASFAESEGLLYVRLSDGLVFALGH